MSLIRDYIDGAYANDDEGEVGIAGFTTVARVRDNIKQTREAPVTYLEDGSHVNDHIIRNPIIVSIEGNISDVHVKPSPVLNQVRDTETIVGEVAQYLPNRTKAQLSVVAGITADVQQQIDRVDSAIRTGQKLAGVVGYTGTPLEDALGVESSTKNNIEQFIDHMAGLLNSDTPTTIEGPVKSYRNMCIISFDYTRDNTTNAMSFTIEAQELRFALTLPSLVATSPAAEANGQHSGESDKGAQEGREVEQSFLDSSIDRVRGWFE